MRNIDQEGPRCAAKAKEAAQSLQFYLSEVSKSGGIDFDAGGIATGEKSIEETGSALFELILEVASGRIKPWSDRWGIFNDFTLFNPGPVT